MKVFVTGAFGYVGSLICQKLLEEGNKVIFYDLNPPKEKSLKILLSHNNCSGVFGDIRKTAAVNRLLYGCDTVIHLAGISDGVAGKKKPALTKEVNADASERLIKEAKELGIKRFLFASSMGVYGDCYEVMTEDNDLKPVDPYSKSKAYVEQILKDEASKEFITCSLRPALIYGSSLNTRMDLLLNKLIKSAFLDGELSLYGGGQRRPQIHVRDVSQIFLALNRVSESIINGNSYNLVYDSPSLLELCEEISIHIPDLKINFHPPRENENSFIMSGDKLINELGLKPKIDYKQGIQTVLDYLKS